jgi:phosphatidylglycerophosphate synthase
MSIIEVDSMCLTLRRDHMVPIIRLFYKDLPRYVYTPANVVTVGRLHFAVGALIAFAFSPQPWLMLLVGAMMLADNLDGWMARRWGATNFGAQLDPIVDKVVAFVAIIVLCIRMATEPEALYVVTLAVMAFTEVAIMLTSNSAIKRLNRVPDVTWHGKRGMFFRNCAYGVILLDLSGEGGIYDWAWPVRVIVLAAIGCCLGMVARAQYANS